MHLIKPIKWAALFIACSFSSLLSAASLDLDEYRGQVVYLDFWASWCVPCRQSFPWMNELHSKYSSQGLKIIAVSVDEDPEAMSEFLADHPANFTVVHDLDKTISEPFSIIGMPTSFVYDREGELLGSHAGFNPKDKQAIEDYLAQLLAK